MPSCGIVGEFAWGRDGRARLCLGDLKTGREMSAGAKIPSLYSPAVAILGYLVKILGFCPKKNSLFSAPFSCFFLDERSEEFIRLRSLISPICVNLAFGKIRVCGSYRELVCAPVTVVICRRSVFTAFRSHF